MHAPLRAQKPSRELITELGELGGKKARSPSAGRKSGPEKLDHFRGNVGFFFSGAHLTFFVLSHSPNSHTLLEAKISKKGKKNEVPLSLTQHFLNKISRDS